MRLFIMCFLAMISMNVNAQGIAQGWISATNVDSTSQIWFRHTYVDSTQPQHAKIAISTTGKVELYVNGYNVSGDTRMPYRDNNDDKPISNTFCISEYLRPDSNTIAVWYSPEYPHIQKQQISLTYWGAMPDGRKFCHQTDSTWFFHKSTHSLSLNGGEIQNAKNIDEDWNSTLFYPTLWQNAIPCNGALAPIENNECLYKSERVNKVIRPSYFDIEGDSVLYEFNIGFYGYIRVTLRDAKKGENIHIGGMDYICNGNMDEQAYRKFTQGYNRRIIISGDRNFRKSQIQNVEGIEICPYFHWNWLY